MLSKPVPLNKNLISVKPMNHSPLSMPALAMHKPRRKKESLSMQIESETRDFLETYKDENQLNSVAEAAREVLRIGQLSVALEEA